MVCNPTVLACIFRKYQACAPASTGKLEQRLQDVFDEHMVDVVKFKKWITTDKSTLKSVRRK